MDSQRVSSSQLARNITGWDLGEGALHRLLADALRERITSGDLPTGAMLPSQRELARVLAVSRTTVGNAYDELTSEGWLSSHRGAGTRIRTSRLRAGPLAQGDRLRTYAAPAEPVDLSSGVLPASPLMGQVLRGNWDQELRGLLRVGFLPWGVDSFREEVASYYDELGLPTTPNQVLATNGSHHALTLLVDCLLEPGDVVLVEDPTYRGALDVFGRRGVQVVGVPVDAGGIDPGALRLAIRKHQPRLVYVLPTAHNVTGVTWSAMRRQQVADVVTDSGVLLVDDGSTADLAPAEHPGHLGALLPEAQSLTIGSLTKLFWAGLRVGWIRGPAEVLQAALEGRVTADIAGSIPSQVLAAACLPLAAAARELRAVELAHDRQAASLLLQEYLPDWTHDPNAAGACLWVDTHQDTLVLASRAHRERVQLIPGSDFSPSDGWRSHVRLPLGRPDVLARGIRALSRLLG
ncbi:PLP-dependent aminotransferase family protein [Aestuariimicrobium sp. Y1814]|uniref:aminotransferase-like domain-containing protein n=1 Tax=Aestuariimicrobium sp. Y1814 TaxID=3418742 RepID=UPI003DA72AB7